MKEFLAEYDKNILVFLNEYLYAKGKNLLFDFDDNVIEALIKKHDFKVFGYYRIALGVIILIYFVIKSIFI